MTVSAPLVGANRSVDDAITALAEAADHVRLGWLPAEWRRVSGPGPDVVPMIRTDRLQPMAGFDGLVLEPGQVTELALDLTLPESIGGVTLAGEPLEVTVESLYAITLAVDDTVILDDTIPVAAGGAALLEVLPEIRSGSNGTLTVAFRPPNNQLEPWWNLFTFGTPGLQRRFELLDLAHAQLLMARALAEGDEDREALAAAAALVPADLTAPDDALRPALAAVAEALQRFHDRARALQVHVVGHSHIDINWQWTWPDTIEVVRRDFRSIVSILDDYPEACFVHSQPVTYEIIRTHEPELFERVLGHIRSGRWEAATLQWSETDSNIPSGESHARQLQEGVAYSREVLGVEPHLFLAPDTFGHAGQVPQLTAQAGGRLYYHHRANPGRRERTIWPAYWWEGAAGSRVLGLSTPLYGGFISATAVAEAAIELGLRRGLDHAMYWHGVIDHGGGPTRRGLDVLRRLEDAAVMPTARCGTVTGYSEAVLASGTELPSHNGETDLIWEGCYTTHADIKRYNRHGESLLGTAETLSVLAGTDHVDELREAWRTVLVNQFHDIIDGTAIRETYDDCARDFERVRDTAEAITAEALQHLRSQVDVGSIAVTNPVGFDRTDIVRVPVAELPAPHPAHPAVRDASGVVHSAQVVDDSLLFVATVPAFATVAFDLVDAGGIADGVRVCTERGLMYGNPTEACLRVDTPHFEVRIAPDSGIITSLIDHRVGRQLVGPATWRWSDADDDMRSDLALNVFQLVDELPHGMSAWTMGRVRAEETLRGRASATVVTSGPVCAVVDVEIPFRESLLRERLFFYSELPRIDATVHLDWNEPGNRDVGVPGLKVGATLTLDGSEAWYETPFAAVRRSADGRERNAQRWADVSTPEYGVAILNESKYGYDALGSRLRLSLVRTAYMPDTSSDTGQHDFAFSIVPHPGDWREAHVVEAGIGYNQPLIAGVAGAATPTALPAWRPRLEGDAGVVISSLKRTNDGSSVAIRVYEAHGRAASARLTGLPSGARVLAATILEDAGEELSVRDGDMELSLAPWEVRTLLVREAAAS